MPLGVPKGCGGLRTSGAGASLPRRVSCCYLAYRVLLCGGWVGGFVCVNSLFVCRGSSDSGRCRGPLSAPPFFCGAGYVQMPSGFRYLADDGSRGMVGVALR